MVTSNISEKRVPLYLGLILLALATGIVAAGFFYYRGYERRFRIEVDNELSAIAQLKASDLARWREERLIDAGVLFKNPAFCELAQRAFAEPADEKSIGQLLTWLRHLQANQEYQQIILFDSLGAERLSAPEHLGPVDLTLQQSAINAQRSGQVVIVDFYRSEPDQRISLALLIPILDDQAGSRPVGTLAIRIDPEYYLYPAIQSWPTPSQSAETLIVRREGDGVVFLNELKHQKNTALTLRIPLEKDDVLAVKAVLGQAGSVEGIDYRGVPVIGNVRAIPNSPWFMVARIDAAEAYAPLRRRLWEIVAFIVSLVLVAGAGVGLVWRQQRTSFYRERYHAAAALQESEQKFRALFESMTEGVALHELLYDVNGKAMDYRILAVNPAFEVHTGIARETIVGALASQAYGAGSPPYLETYAGVAESGTPAVFETYFPPLEKHFQISAISPKRGQFATVFEDITGRKQKEELLRQQNEDITRFAYTVSHDLKSPLVTILAFLGFLEEDLQKTDAARIAKDIAYIRTAAEKMSRLLDELLEYSRIGRKANSPETAPLQAVVQEAVDLVAGRIAARGAHIQVTPEPILLYGDRPRLVEIFQNLVDNAVKFMGDQPDPTVEIGVELEEGELVIFVRDNGMGIDPRFHKKLFNLFEKLDAASEGTGIGLAMVKRIVEVHGGTIWVESRGQGHGTTFYFTLANMVRAQPKEAAG